MKWITDWLDVVNKEYGSLDAFTDAQTVRIQLDRARSRLVEARADDRALIEAGLEPAFDLEIETLTWFVSDLEAWLRKRNLLAGYYASEIARIVGASVVRGGFHPIRKAEWSVHAKMTYGKLNGVDYKNILKIMVIDFEDRLQNIGILTKLIELLPRTIKLDAIYFCACNDRLAGGLRKRGFTIVETTALDAFKVL